MHRSPKKKVLFATAAIFCLSQCTIWSIIYLSAVSLYSCTTPLSYFTNLMHREAELTEAETDELDQTEVNVNITGSRVHYVSTLTYVAYLWNGKCKRGNGTKPSYWPEVIAPSERTYKWMFAYSIVTSCWIPASIGLMIAAFYARSKDAVVCMSLPWIVNTFILTVMDLTAAIIYAKDIPHMRTKRDYLHFIGVQVADTSHIEGITPPGWKYDTILPAIIFVMIYSRLVVIWLINTYLLVNIYRVIRNIRSKKRKERKQTSQNFEMSMVNSLQDRVPGIQTINIPDRSPTYVPWMDVVTLTQNEPGKKLSKKRKPGLYINTRLAEEYNRAKIRRKDEDVWRPNPPNNSLSINAPSSNDIPQSKPYRRRSEEYGWQEKLTDDLSVRRRFSEQQSQIKLIAERLEQRKKEQQNGMIRQTKTLTLEPTNWYEPIWEMETSESDGHYTTIENELYSPVFDYLGKPTSQLQNFRLGLDPAMYQKCRQQIILTPSPLTPSPTNIRGANPLRRIWNEIQLLQDPAKSPTKPPPSPKIDYEL